MNQGFRSGLLTAVLVGAIGVIVASGQAVRQKSAGQGMLPTVSVATLRIPAKAWEHFEKARTAAKVNHEEECLRETAKALEIAPDFADVYLLKAAYEISIRRFTEAIDDSLAAQKIEPGIGWSATLLAGAYNGLHRYDDAFVIIANVHGAEAETWQAKYERTRAEIGRGNVEGALHWSELTLKVAPDWWLDAHLLRADALQLDHRWKEAIAEMQAYLASPRPQPHRVEILALLENAKKMAEQQEAVVASVN